MTRTHWASALLLMAVLLSACGGDWDEPPRGHITDAASASATSGEPASPTATGSTGPDMSEAAWRTALGLDVIPDKVWRRYRDSIYNICDSSEFGFQLTVSMMLDNDGREAIDRFRKSLPYACPEYVELFDETTALAEDPCAGLTPAERRDYEQVMRAKGERGWTCP